MHPNYQRFLNIFNDHSTPMGCERDLSPEELAGMDDDSDEGWWVIGGMSVLLVIVPLVCYWLIH